MDVKMDTSPNYLDPEDLSTRQQFRRYGKRQFTSSVSPAVESPVSNRSETGLLYDGNSVQRLPNVALLLEEIKQEVGLEAEGLETSAPRLLDSMEMEFHSGFESTRKDAGLSLKSYKHEDEVLSDGAESIFSMFASLLDSALQGLISFPDLILRFEGTCRTVSAAIRYENFERHRVVEDKFLQQKARLLLDEAASWSLLWYLFGKANEELTEDLVMSPTTSHQEACRFVMTDHAAQLCLRVVLWLEGLASESLELEKKIRGSHVGSYLPSSGIWHHTQRFLKKHKNDPDMVQHLDFDAPTREGAQQLPDDRNQDNLLLEDIWTLLRAGRLEEACELCRSAGQPWRAASLCPFGGLDHFPSVEAMHKNGTSRILQAIELESGIAHQLRLWKWALYCASEKIAEQDGGGYEMAVYSAQCSNLKRLLPVCTDWESACWAMAKSWLDFQVDLELSRIQPGKQEDKAYREEANGPSLQESQKLSNSNGPESWPYHVLDQQPRDISALLQKMHSGEIVHHNVARACKEQHRQIEMSLMVCNVPQLLDLLWSWMSPLEDDQNVMRPNGDPQMIRFGAHIVLVLRCLIGGDELKEPFREKLSIVGDRILNMYAMFLFAQQHEELIGMYASQLARHLCIDLFVNLMDLRLHGSMQVKYKLFVSALEYLPFSLVDKSKASFEEIIERVLSRSREVKAGKYEAKPADVAEQHRLQSLEKAMVIQWLCFTPPSTVSNFEIVSVKLLMRALVQSNVLFREFSLISMWRVPKMPSGAHMLLGFLAEPLKRPKGVLLSSDEPDASENLHEFEDWHEYYSCDATYRKWLKAELENASVPPAELSVEEREQAAAAARETLDSCFALIARETSPWLNAAHQSIFDESMGPLYLEVYATAMFCLPSGECLCPDATLCTALTSALYSSVSEEDVLKRELSIKVSIHSRDCCFIEVAVRCLAVSGDGLGFHEANDGGFVATVLAAGFKGELSRFQARVAMEISRLDAWYSDAEGPLDVPATYIVRGLCRRCCLPEMVLRCLQVSVSLAESGDALDRHDELIDLVTSSETGLLNLFSQHQLQEFLLFERDCTLYQMEFREESAVNA